MSWDRAWQGFCCCIRRKTKPRQLKQADVRTGEVHRFRYEVGAAATHLETGPVLDNSNTNDPMYLGSWIAEVSIAHPNGDLIRKYQEQQQRLEQVRLDDGWQHFCSVHVQAASG